MATRAFARAAVAAGLCLPAPHKPDKLATKARARGIEQTKTPKQIPTVRPYDLRHRFASLLLHEGRSVIYVARQLGHGAQLTLGRYGHVIDELDDKPNLDAEAAIAAAREGGAAHGLPMTAS